MPEPIRHASVATQTDSTAALSYDSLGQTARLGYGYVWQDASSLYDASDAAMSERIACASACPIEASVSRCNTFTAYIGNPIDARPYVVPGSRALGLLKLEDNTSGWGRILSVPHALRTDIACNLTCLGLALSQRNDTVTVLGYSSKPFSGKFVSNPSARSCVGMQAWLADCVAEGLRRRAETFVIGFDRATIAEHLRRIDQVASHKATVIIGSFIDMLAFQPVAGEAAVVTMNDGQVLFCGKRVQCVLNELFVSYIEARFEKIDRKKTWVGPMVSIGTDKSKAYEAHNAFVKELEIDEGSRLRLAAPIRFRVCHAEADVLAAAATFAADGKGYVCKPKGTFGGQGIIVILPGQHDPQGLMQKIRESVSILAAHFGDSRYGGWPYTVCEYVKTPLIRVPEELRERYGHLEGYQFEVRIGVSKRLDAFGEDSLIAVPACIRLQHPSSLLSNVTAQRRALRGNAADYLLPALHHDTMRLTGFDEAAYTEMAVFYARYQAFAISRSILEEEPA